MSILLSGRPYRQLNVPIDNFLQWFYGVNDKTYIAEYVLFSDMFDDEVNSANGVLHFWVIHQTFLL